MPHRNALVALIGATVLMVACSSGTGPTTSATLPGVTAAPGNTSPPSTAASSVPSSTASTTTLAPPPAPLRLLTDEPVVSPFGEDSFTNPGAVVLGDGAYYMFRNSFSAFPGETTVTVLSSPDGITWEEASSEPVFGTEFVDGADGTVFLFAAYVDEGGTWVGYFYTFDGFDAPGFIGRATAPGPVGPWVADSDPVLTPGTGGSWDDQRVAEPSLVRNGDELFMYYTGFNVSDGNGRIGLATSTDGLSWTKYDDPDTRGPVFGESDPVLFASHPWEGNSIGGPQVLAPGEGFVMLYDLADLQSFGVGMAVSDDGVEWSSVTDESLLTTADTPNQRRFFQSELIEGPEGPLWLLEVFDDANARTVLYPFLLDPDAVDRDSPAAAVSAVATPVDGDVIVEVLTTGFEARFARGDTSGATGHVHVYVDRDPPAPGDEVPLGDPTIVHSTTSTVRLTDLEAGLHELWVVVADGADRALIPPAPVRVDIFIP